jgi:hypothetical protein
VPGAPTGSAPMGSAPMGGAPIDSATVGGGTTGAGRGGMQSGRVRPSAPVDHPSGAIPRPDPTGPPRPAVGEPSAARLERPGLDDDPSSRPIRPVSPSRYGTARPGIGEPSTGSVRPGVASAAVRAAHLAPEADLDAPPTRGTGPVSPGRGTEPVSPGRGTEPVSPGRGTEPVSPGRGTGPVPSGRGTGTVSPGPLAPAHGSGPTGRGTGPITTGRGTGPITTGRGTGPIRPARGTGRVAVGSASAGIAGPARAEAGAAVPARIEAGAGTAVPSRLEDGPATADADDLAGAGAAGGGLAADLRQQLRTRRRLRVVTLVTLSAIVLVLLPLLFSIRATTRDPVFTSLDTLDVPSWAAQKVSDRSSGSRWCFIDCRFRERTAQSQQAFAATDKVYASALKSAGWQPWKVAGCPDQPIAPTDGAYSCWRRDEFTLDLWVRLPECAVDQVAANDPAVLPSTGPDGTVPKPPPGKCTGSTVSIKVQNAITDKRGTPDGEKPGLTGETPDPVLSNDPLLEPTPSPS